MHTRVIWAIFVNRRTAARRSLRWRTRHDQQSNGANGRHQGPGAYVTVVGNAENVIEGFKLGGQVRRFASVR
jgi:hypothetical protein